MARDMSVEVRLEAFNALTKIEAVSEDILLQTLSKRVLGSVKEKRSLGQCCAEQFETLVSSVAGAIVHGLEDEFFEVTFSLPFHLYCCSGLCIYVFEIVVSITISC